MRLRRARPRDFADLIAVWERAVSVSHRFVDPVRLAAERRWLNTLYLPACDIWMAEADRTMGFIALYSNGEIAGLFVDPQYQGRGIGYALLDHIKGAAVLQLEVAAPNFKARRFYAGYGFQEVARRRDPDLSEEMVIMRCDDHQEYQTHG